MQIRTPIQLLLPALALLGLVACEQAPQPPAQVRMVSYADEVAPILQQHCAACHGADGPGTEATGLRLDSYASLLQGSNFGPVITAGSAKVSSLYILISSGDDLTVHMPRGMDPLPADDIETIRLWIDQGAPDN